MVTQVDLISEPPTPADPPDVFEVRASQVWSDLARAVPQMNEQAQQIEQIGEAAVAAAEIAIAQADHAMGYRNEARQASDAALEHKSAAAASAGAAFEHAGSAATDAARAETAAASAENRVPTTGQTGAAIFPSGPESDRPDPAQHEGKFLVRGNADTGKLEWYDWGAQKWKTIGSGEGRLFEFDIHHGPRSTIPVGFYAYDGQVIQHADNPQVCEAIWAGQQHVVDDVDWPSNKNCWSRGDGLTWVRAPDLNDAAGTDRAFYLRGSPESLNGSWVDDAIRNIVGQLNAVNGNKRGNQGSPAGTGALRSFASGTGHESAMTSGPAYGFTFDASLSVPTAEENRVKTAHIVYIFRAFSEVQNAGAIDAAQIATQLARVDAQVQRLGAIRYEPEALWIGSAGNVVELTLSREVLEGELLVLKHSTAGASGLTSVQAYMPSIAHQSDGGTYMAFSSGNANTGCVLRQPEAPGGQSVMKMLTFTSGYGVSGIYAIKQKS